MVKTLVNPLLWNCWTDFNKTWCVTLGTLAQHILYKSWPLVDVGLFYGKVNIGHIGFSMKKMETLDFSESFVACDLNIGTYLQLNELMRFYEYSRSMSSLDIGQRSFT